MKAELYDTLLSWNLVTSSFYFFPPLAVGFLFWSCLLPACFTWMAATFWPHTLDLFNCLVFSCSGWHYFKVAGLQFEFLLQCKRFFAIYMLLFVTKYVLVFITQSSSLGRISSRVSSTSSRFTVCFNLLQITHPSVLLFFFPTDKSRFKWSNSVWKKANSLHMAFTCSFVSLTIYRCLLKSQNQNFLEENYRKKVFFLQKLRRKFWHWITMSRLLSVLV